MGGVVSIWCLMINPGDMSEGSSEFARARACVATGGSGCEALDDSLGPEVLAFLVGGHSIELWGCEVVTLCVVAGLLVSYLRWGAEDEGLVGTPPSEWGICGAGGLLGWRIMRHLSREGSLPWSATLRRAARAPRVCAIWKWRNGSRVHARRGVSNRRGTEEWDAKGGRVNRGWNQNRGTGWHYEEATRWQRDSQWEGACEMGKKWGS